ncbi:hypothetical protein HYX14_06135 [Candidatus Woesearchaeota archaeon]|nr:hypothetical protein [Candidatus Woesearchaeota archaeon]
MTTWNLKGYLKTRSRSTTEQQMNILLQKISNNQYTVENLQEFNDTTTRPLDFLREHETELELTGKNGSQFMELLMKIWNSTPRTEFNGRTPEEMYEHNKKDQDHTCALCTEKKTCPDCGAEINSSPKKTEEGAEIAELNCPDCGKKAMDVKIPFPPEEEQSEEEESLIEEIAGNLHDDAFEEVWSHAKKETKDYSKKEVAEGMFYAGLCQALDFMNTCALPKEILTVLATVSRNLDDPEQLERDMADLESQMKQKE